MKLVSPVDEAIARLPAEYEAIGRMRVSHLLDTEELLSQWDAAARTAARAATLATVQSARDYYAGCSSTYELCAAQLRAVLARPARPDASDHEDEGE